MESTTIQISKNLKKELDKMKIFDRETYEEVIWDIIEDTKEISEETKKEIEEARKEIARGEFVTLSEIKKKYSIE